MRKEKEIIGWDTEKNCYTIVDSNALMQLLRTICRMQHVKPCLVDEVCSATVVKVQLSVSRFDPKKASLTTWVSVILKRTHLDILAESAKWADPINHRGDEDPVFSLIENIASDTPNAEVRMERKDRQNKVQRVLDSMSGVYRKIIELLYFEDMNGVEVAQTLQIPHEQFAVYHMRAKNMFRQRFGERW